MLESPDSLSEKQMSTHQENIKDNSKVSETFREVRHSRPRAELVPLHPLTGQDCCHEISDLKLANIEEATEKDQVLEFTK